MVQRSRGEKIFDVMNAILLGLLAAAMLFPFWSVFMTSFTSTKEYYTSNIIIFPASFNIEAYKFILSTKWILSSFSITVIVTVLGTLYDMFMVCTCAYGLSKKGLPFRRTLMVYFTTTMYVSGGLIPYYLVVVQQLHLRDSLAAMIITSGLNVWSFLVLKNFFHGIPDSLAESAQIDGAGEYRILFKIILPLALPAVATLSLFIAITYWNGWSKALYFISDENKFPLQLVLRRMVLDTDASVTQNSAMEKAYEKLFGGSSSSVNEEAIKTATLAISSIPMIMLYPFIQRYFVKGVTLGSVKE
jgi:putative aldouronate transport system permease protein